MTYETLITAEKAVEILAKNPTGRFLLGMAKILLELPATVAESEALATLVSIHIEAPFTVREAIAGGLAKEPVV